MASEEIIIYTAEGDKYESKPSWAIAEAVVFVVVGLFIVGLIAAAVHHDAYKAGFKDGRAEMHVASTSPQWTIIGDAADTTTLTSSDISSATTIDPWQAEQKRRDRIWNRRPRLEPPVDAPPSSIKVGPYTYHVYYTSKKALESLGGLACTQIGDREIWLNPHRISNLQDDLLHELMHAARDLGTGGERFAGTMNSEDNAIFSMSTGLLVIMQDNPELVVWLQKK